MNILKVKYILKIYLNLHYEFYLIFNANMSKSILVDNLEDFESKVHIENIYLNLHFEFYLIFKANLSNLYSFGIIIFYFLIHR